MERYQALEDGFTRELMDGARREQEHRHAIESRLVSLDESAMPKFYEGQKRGQYVSLALGALYLVVMLVAILEGAAWVGGGGAALGIAAMVWAIRRDPSGPDSSQNEVGGGDVGGGGGGGGGELESGDSGNDDPSPPQA